MALALVLVASSTARAADPWVVFEGGDGPGKGKKIVLVSGDEEYRSEEALPQLAKILATKHGFTCTVLFAIGKDGTIDPNRNDNIPGLESLKDADLMVLFTRFRNLPDDQMKMIADYLESGRPVIGMRTATHAFNIDSKREFARFSHNSKKPDWDGGFGRQVFGETWISHHGSHRQAEHPRHPRPRRRVRPDPPRDQGRRYFWPDGCLRRPPAAPGRHQAAHPGPGSRRDEPVRPSRRRQGEQPR